jgi:mannitol/fructose-specific phosphotransferase system IIA component (Ntr-type)
MLIDREKNSSTVIEPGLSIPHLMLPGSNKFILAMARAKDGIYFDNIHTPVKAAFILLGSENERNFHLKALMNIAHIVQDAEFKDRWIRAQSAEQLRDLVLLTRKNRVSS